MKSKKENSILDRLNQLRPLLKLSKLWILLNCTTAFTSGLIMVYFTIITKNITDMAINKQVNEFKAYLWVTFFIIALNILIGYIHRYSSVRYTGDFAYNMRNRMVKNIMDLPLDIKEEYHSGDIVSRINNDISIVTELVEKIPDIVYNPVVFITTIIYMYSISRKLLICSIILMPLSGYIFNILSKPLEKNSRQLMEDTGKINEIIKDTINGAYILKDFSLEEVLLKKYNERVEKMLHSGKKMVRINASLMRIFLALRYIPQLIIPLLGGYLAIKGEITIGQLLASTLLISFVFNPIESLLALLKHTRLAIPAMDRVFEIINKEAEVQEGNKFEIDDKYPIVEFSNVCFGYNKENKVLNNINLVLKKGTVTAITGPSGCGKTTILKLLCSFYKIQKGNISVFGNNLLDCSPSDIRRNISYVSQNPYLFPTTVYENIGYGREGAGVHEITEAARLANAHAFIMDLPNGYDTKIGDGNLRLSGGEQQRIALARAILKNAPMLILDEATSALDLESESLVQKSLQEFMKDRTVLVVAHRMSTIKEADMIFIINDGEIVEKGLHGQLIDKSIIYKRLYNKQISLKDCEGGMANA